MDAMESIEHDEAQTDLVPISWVCKKLNKSRSTIHAWIDKGLFPEWCRPFTLTDSGTRTYYFRKEEILRFIEHAAENNRINPKEDK